MRMYGVAASLLLSVVGCHRSSISASDDPSVASSEPVDAAGMMALGMADLTPAPDPVALPVSTADAMPTAVPVVAAAPERLLFPINHSVPDDFHLNINRSLCMGPCTSFNADIDAHGTITLTGTAFANHDLKRPIEGCATKQIGKNGVLALIDMLKKDNFPALRELYSSGTSDRQDESVSVDMNHTHQYVDHELGFGGEPQDAHAIASLKSIEARLESLTGASAFVASPKSMPCKK